MVRTAAEVQDELDTINAKWQKLDDELAPIGLAVAGNQASEGEIERADRLVRGLRKLEDQRDALTTELGEIVRAEKVAAVKDLIRGGSAGTESGDGAHHGEVRRTRRDPDDQVISRALKILDDEGGHLTAEQGDKVDSLLRSGRTPEFEPTYLAQRLALTECDAYRSAFFQVLQAGQNGAQAVLTAEEAHAMRAFQDFEYRHVSRAASEGTNSAGGYGVPVLIDASVIITSGAADAPILNVCRIEQVTTSVWKGVSASGMSWSYDAEASEVSDDTPTLAQPTVTVYTPRGFLPFSLEVGMDYPGFAAEMQRLLNQGYLDLIASQTMTGFGGTTSPRGIFTACAANTATCQVVTTTDGAFGGPDVFRAWNALPERYRSRATWVMSVSVESAVRQFASSAGSSSSYFTVDLTADGVSKINGRPVIVTDYAPSFTGSVPGTTGAANILVVGAFDNYLMANRAGMSVEPVPLMLGSNRRPSGQRGIFAWARHGFDSVNDNGFRILSNT